MHLQRLTIRKAPGLPQGIELPEFSGGLVILLGPNGSGKSTVGRTIQGTLWPKHTPQGVDAQSTWRPAHGGPVLQASLVFGLARWQGEPVTLGDELALNSQLSLADLLQDDATGDRAIARQIQTQLDGGFDLSQLGSNKKTRNNPTPGLSRKKRDAAGALAEQISKTDAIEIAHAGLAALEAKQKAASGAPAAISRIERAKERLEHRQDLAEQRRILADLPDDVATMPAEASQTLTSLAGDLSTQQAEMAEAQAARDESRGQAGDLAFPQAPPSEASLVALVARADALLSLDDELRALRKDAAKAKGRVAKAQEQVWTHPALDALPSSSQVEALHDALTARNSARDALSSLPHPKKPTSTRLSDAERKRAHDASSLLHEWMTTPRQVVLASPSRPSVWFTAVPIALGVVFAVMGLALAWLLSPWLGLLLFAAGAALCALGLGLWLAPMLQKAATSGPHSEVDAIERRYAQADFAPVSVWQSAEVSAVIDTLKGQLREHESALREAQDATRDEEDRSRAQSKLGEAEVAVAKTAKALGIQPNLPGLTQRTQADRIVALAAANTDKAGADKAASAAAGHVTELASALRAELDALKLSGLPSMGDAIGLKGAASAALDRHRKWTTASDRLNDAEAALSKAGPRLAKAQSKYDTHLTACGVSADELHTLSQREEQQASWKRATDEATRLDLAISGLNQQLPEGLPDTAEGLDEELARLEVLASTLTEFSDQISDIKKEVREATDGRTMAQAIAAQDDVLDQLADDRDVHLIRHATEALAAWLRDHRRHDSAPELLKRARTWFLRFTHNRYELQVSPDAGFLALDTHTNRHQALSELSDGTRVQLLLAARLAFLEHAERDGEKTPLFLDEVLSTTDPQRFAAVATAVLQLVKDGRQVFYATPDPGEVASWQKTASEGGFAEPQVVVLAPPDVAEQWAVPPKLPQPLPAVPAPDGLDAIGYIKALKLPRPTLHNPVETWPLALVLHDRLPAAHAAAKQGLKHVGQLELAASGVRVPLDEADLYRANASVVAIRAVLLALRVGRGRSVTWNDVCDSEAITAAFETRAQTALLAHGDDAVEYVRAIENLPRFRTANAEKLREHLIEVSCLDPSPTLPEGVVVSRAQQASSDAIASKLLRFDEIEPLVAFVRDVVLPDA